jgi:hypothetical protein
MIICPAGEWWGVVLTGSYADQLLDILDKFLIFDQTESAGREGVSILQIRKK